MFGMRRHVLWSIGADWPSTSAISLGRKNARKDGTKAEAAESIDVAWTRVDPVSDVLGWGRITPGKGEGAIVGVIVGRKTRERTAR